MAISGVMVGYDQMQQQNEKAELLLFNGNIYTVDKDMSVVTSMIIDDGRVLDTVMKKWRPGIHL